MENVAYAWNASVYNFAFGGATCDTDLYALDRSDMSPSIRDQIEIYYDQKLDLKPEETVYAIWIGINDIALATGKKFVISVLKYRILYILIIGYSR